MFSKYAANLQENTHAEVWFQQSCKVTRTSAWVFSFKFAAYFQNTFSQERLWVTASGSCNLCVTKVNNNLEIASDSPSLDLCHKLFSFLPPVGFEII